MNPVRPGASARSLAGLLVMAATAAAQLPPPPAAAFEPRPAPARTPEVPAVGSGEAPAGRGAAPPEGSRRDPRDLPGTPGEDEAGYPYPGARFGGTASVGSFVNSTFEGNEFELQRDDLFPRNLILQQAALWWGNSGRTLLEVDWEAPTELDTRFQGRYRDFRNFDLSLGREDFFSYDRPREERSQRHLDHASGRLRKWSRVHLDWWVGAAEVRRRAMSRDRDASFQHVDVAATWLGSELRADLQLRVTRYQDALEPTDDHLDRDLRLRLRRDISPDTHLSASVVSEERQLDVTGEAQRDLGVALSTRTYDALRLKGLKVLTEARYRTRTSSFQRTHDEEQQLRLGGRAVYNLRGGGAVEAGIRKTWRQDERITRQGIDRLLADATTPRSELLPLREDVHPTVRDAWFKATARVAQVKLFGSLDVTDLDAAPRSSWVAPTAAPLVYTNRQVYRGGLAAHPFAGVDARFEHSQEDRHISARGDHDFGQRQRAQGSSANFALSFVPRVRLDLDLTNQDLIHADDVVAEETAHEATTYGLGVEYDLGQRLVLESRYRRINYDGAITGIQELVEAAIDYGGTGSRSHLRVAFTFDDYLDPLDADASYRARVFSVSGGLDF